MAVTARKFITTAQARTRAGLYAKMAATLSAHLTDGRLMGPMVEEQVRAAADALKLAADHLDAGRVE